MTRLPITGPFRVTAVYGQQGTYWKSGHKGIDLVADDHRIYSTCEGTVRTVAFDADGLGQYIAVDDQEGQRHYFCHLVKGSAKVKVGQKVTPLTVIGTMGATGNVTGLHLHYELRRGSQVLDPAAWLGIPNRVGSYHSNDFQIKEEKPMAYRDEASIPEWAKDAVKEATEKGLMKGDDEGNFRPNDPITRAEMAVLLSRL
ncbi:MAG: peptidoglycan DD-metalloendopeptidase family protein [Clostridia bacterium]|nr:peptidoglycan DD-metalloendopeptidase family protein [Clostridia bacterium]